MLFEFALKEAIKRYPNTPIKLSAQTYIQRFYAHFGFKAVGKEYLEDDIPHIAMVFSP